MREKNLRDLLICERINHKSHKSYLTFKNYEENSFENRKNT